MSQSLQSEGRIRKLTMKAKEVYELKVLEHSRILSAISKNINSIMSDYGYFKDKDQEKVIEIESQLKSEYLKYKEQSTLFIDYLTTLRTEESFNELASHKIVIDSIKSKIDMILKDIDESKSAEAKAPSEKVSHRSRNSIRSRNSHFSSSHYLSDLLLEKKVKAEAEKVKLRFAEEQSKLKLEEISSQVKQELLVKKCDAAVAEAEYNAIIELSESEGNGSKSSDDQSVSNAFDRTQAYVTAQNELLRPKRDFYVSSTPRLNIVQNVSSTPAGQMPDIPTYDDNLSLSLGATFDIKPELQIPQSSLNPNVASFTPKQEQTFDTFSADFTKFLLKKELLMSRLTKFTDQPETFNIWKCSFKNIMSELAVNPSEELDLLIKWLGPQSVKHAISLRASNANNPKRGLDRVWDRLDERYGSPEVIESTLKKKLDKFPKLSLKETNKFYELTDILSEIESIKENEAYRLLFGYFDTSSGVKPIVSKLPYSIQTKWINHATKYKRQYGVSFPPFTEFVSFMREISSMLNDPGFSYEPSVVSTNINPNQRGHPRGPHIGVNKTEITPDTSSLLRVDVSKKCPLHGSNHTLNNCRGFRLKTFQNHKAFLKANNICFKCCESNNHQARDCKVQIKCSICQSNRHPTALHVDKSTGNVTVQDDGGEKTKVSTELKSDDKNIVKSMCTSTDSSCSRSCAKIVLVKAYNKFHPQNIRTMYAIIDDQSNRSLASTEFFEFFHVHSEPVNYELQCCSGKIMQSGRTASDFVVETIDGTVSLNMPTLIECNEIPDIRQEIPTPEIANVYPHLRPIANQIPSLDPEANISLLIGRDLLQAHHVLDQIIDDENLPFAQRTVLGWVIIGDTCLGGVHRPNIVSVNKTNILKNNRTSIFEPCANQLMLREMVNDSVSADLNSSIFARHENDHKIGLSENDLNFLGIMDKEGVKNENGNWSAPLPFKESRKRLPNNRASTFKRAIILHNSMVKNPQKQQHMMDFMHNIFSKGHAEIAPPIANDEEVWYLPIFGVYNPNKPNQIRAVFDSSARFENFSLNDTLLSGPDLTNNLLGVLMRFRREKVAVTADIEQMFYCFKVQEHHRNFLRFFWYRDNDFKNELTEYRMTVHVFGNTPSPSVATYFLRKSVEDSNGSIPLDVKDFVQNNFYVDDGLVSCSTPLEAIELMSNTQKALKQGGNLRLHKIASNNKEVIEAFSVNDLAKDLKDFHDTTNLPLQRSLGLKWDLVSDTFTYRMSNLDKPYTRRGILSVVNSLFDPIGFIAPVVIKGKILMRDIIKNESDWDSELPPEMEPKWVEWKNNLTLLENFSVPRRYTNQSFKESEIKEIHIFTDASEKAISAVAYLRMKSNNNVEVGFVLGKSKVAPTSGHSIPRLELCTAVLGIEIGQIVSEQLSISLEDVKYYTDSKVTLGYIHNSVRRFRMYVCNRVQYIRRFSKPMQWSYIHTEDNPADHGTRYVPAQRLQDSPWIIGPKCLFHDGINTVDGAQVYPLIDPEKDKDIRIVCNKSKVETQKENCAPISEYFKRFSSWTKLINAVASLKGLIRKRFTNQELEPDVLLSQSEVFVINSVQQENFRSELELLKSGKNIPKNSPLISLGAILDKHEILRVGGRFNKSDLCTNYRNPIIIPGRSYIARLLIMYYHDKVCHQGRHFTEGAIRDAGYWITGAKRLISSILRGCVKCRKLRGKFEIQKMADLPVDRLTPGPPFSSVGVDAFGPWEVIARKTRGGVANAKRWAILFTCLTTRAIHIEVIEEMTSSSFINAMRRFIAVRGKVKEFRSDRGSNFVGAVNELGLKSINVEDSQIKSYLSDSGTVWKFNPPHSSHMGGIWERMIGVTRRILDSMLMDFSSKHLTHEVLVTFFAEVSAIVNARPIVPVASDTEVPAILSPSMLLTQKCDCVVIPSGSFNINDMYKAHWKRVQALSDVFWCRWKKEYLQHLQKRTKWTIQRPNVQVGDIVLLKDSTYRNEWPMGIIVQTYPSSDGLVRKVKIKISKNDDLVTYVRPVSELVILISSDTTNDKDFSDMD